MSSGPGILQNLILERLHERSPLLLRELLWEIGFQRGEIIKTGKAWGEIKEGKLKKSLTENLRRAVRGLVVKRRISLSKRKLTNFEDVFHYNPFLTSKLEIYLLRNNMSGNIEEYVEQEISTDTGKLDYDENQIETLRTSDSSKYGRLLDLWLEIEHRIISLFPRIESGKLDPWIDILIRGRYIFALGTRALKTPLTNLLDRLRKDADRDDAEVREFLILLGNLLKQISANEQWKIGRIKNKFHTFLNTAKYTRPSIQTELKEYLLDKNPTLLRSLPGHHEPSMKIPNTIIRFGQDFYPNRVYSPLLDQLFDRQIFRQHFFVALN